MYEPSKYANWLLATLLFTLLLSSLILGWLLTRSSVFANPSLLTTAQLAGQDLAATSATNSNPVKAIQIPSIKTERQIIALEMPNTNTEKPIKPNQTIATTHLRLPAILADSQEYLEQAAITPQALLPLASLVANQPNTLPKTTAPAALTVQGLLTSTNPAQQPLKYKSAWLYAGQFQNGKWSLLGLDIDSTTLPEPNHSYKLTWGAKVRSAPPSQRMSTASANLAESIGYLAEGSSIQVLNVKQSGKNGHIWLEIAYGE